MSSRLVTILCRGILAVSCLSAVWRVHFASSNWYLYLISGSLQISDTPLLAVLGFFFIFLATIFNIIQFGFQKSNVIIIHDPSLWFVSNVGLSFITIHFNVVYQKYFFAWFQFVNLLSVILASFILPIKMTKILRHLQQASAVMSIIIVSFYNQNWHGVLGAQLIAIATLSIGTEGTLFGLPAFDAFYCVLACATYLLSRAVSIVDL